MNQKKITRRYYRKKTNLLLLIEKIKLWISRNQVLHGIKNISFSGEMMHITTHCNKEFFVRNSKNSRAARYLRNKTVRKVCPACGVPDWKIEKFDSTRFRNRAGKR